MCLPGGSVITAVIAKDSAPLNQSISYRRTAWLDTSRRVDKRGDITELKILEHTR